MKIIDRIKSGYVLVSDGAWGTFLQKKGLKAGECPELWNLTKPEEVYDVAKSYIDAGADIIETNSFGGNYFKLKLFGLEDKVYEINKAAAEISRKAAGPSKYVIGSVGPTGKFLIMGDVTENELYDSFSKQCSALSDGGADAIIIETISDIEEAKIAIKAAKDNTKCEVFCTMTFEKSGNYTYHTMMGCTPSQMVEELIKLNIDALGANCGNGIEGMIDIVKEIRLVNKDIPVIIHANAGLPIYKDGTTIFPETPEQMAAYIEPLYKYGANIIGGCCGTTPEHIRNIASIIKEINITRLNSEKK
jgi:5-methyltetrahydrofolate--homocysteine methyltransferase